MKAYVIVTGLLFVLLLVAHVWRAALEGWAPLQDPLFVGSSLVAAGMPLWAWRVHRALRR